MLKQLYVSWTRCSIRACLQNEKPATQVVCGVVEDTVSIYWACFAHHRPPSVGPRAVETPYLGQGSYASSLLPGQLVVAVGVTDPVPSWLADLGTRRSVTPSPLPSPAGSGQRGQDAGGRPRPHSRARGGAAVPGVPGGGHRLHAEGLPEGGGPPAAAPAAQVGRRGGRARLRRGHPPGEPQSRARRRVAASALLCSVGRSTPSSNSQHSDVDLAPPLPGGGRTDHQGAACAGLGLIPASAALQGFVSDTTPSAVLCSPLRSISPHTPTARTVSFFTRIAVPHS